MYRVGHSICGNSVLHLGLKWKFYINK
jgi:hypothetical protein